MEIDIVRAEERYIESHAPSLSHTGILGMGIRRGYRGLGIGNRLMQACLEAADAKGLARVELLVLDRNQNAKALYLKHGFKVEGRMERYVRLEGIFQSADLMSRMP
jgi:putative acetyltransferase